MVTGVYSQGKWTQEGDAAYEKGDYARALELYQWGEKRKEGPLAIAGQGMAHFKLRDFATACSAFEKVDFSQLNSNLPEFQLAYAQSLMSLERYSEAMGNVLPVLTHHPDHELARILLQVCMNPVQLLADSNRFAISKVPFNSAESDFCPVIFEEGVVFSTSVDQRIGVNFTSETHDKKLVDLYFIPKEDSLNWGKARPLEGQVNTRYHDGPACFNAGGDRIYFTRNNYLDGKRGFSSNKINKLKLFTAEWEENKGWTGVTEMPFNSDEFSVGHPSLSRDGNTLVFVSDRPGGYGGTDLYRVRRQGEDWGEVENLGPMVNTPENEMFPFLHPDGNLYFSSDGHPGLGGLDLYVTLLSDKGVGTVTHLGVPLNSSFDDFGMFLDSAGKSGFFSSNRGEDPFNDDIYALQLLWPEFSCSPQEETPLCYEFSDIGMLEDPSKSGLVYQWDFGDGTYKTGLQVDHCFPGPGKYLIKLNLVDSVSQFVFMNEVEYELVIEEKEQVYIAGPDALLPGDPVDLSGLKSKVPGCDLLEFYWELGDGRRFKGPEIALAFEQAGDYEVRLGVTGRTAEGAPCGGCVSKLIQVLEKRYMVTYLDSVAKEKERKEGGGFISGNDIQRQENLNQLPNIDPVSTRKFSLMDTEVDLYRVQIARSNVPIPTDSSIFEGLPEVKEFEENGVYSYTVGEKTDPVELLPEYRQAKGMGFEATVMVGTLGDSIVAGQDPNYFITFPTGAKKNGTFSTIRGQLTDLKGNPVQARLEWEDLVKGEIYATSTSTKDGKYYMKLPNGVLYGITAEAKNYYAFSDALDLRDVVEPTNFVGDIKVVSIEEMIQSGKAYTLKNIFFDYDHYTLRPESYRSLDKLARILIENEGLKVEIRGHTDSRGNDEYNIRLSKRRASEVLKYLILSGYNVDNIISNGYGETMPIANNDTPKGRQLNRRVEFKFFRDANPTNQ